MDYTLEKFNFNHGFLRRVIQSNILLYCVVVLLSLRIMTAFISLNLPQNIFFADITKTALESFANQTRQSLGLSPLAENAKLNQAAQLKAQNMVLNNYFAHTSPTGITPWHWFLQAGYNYKYAGENLAIGFLDSEEVYNAWINSPSHKANILNPNYKEVGTAVLSGFGQNNTIIVVQEFGSQQAPKTTQTKPAAAPPKQNPVAEKPVTAAAPASAEEKVLSQSAEASSAIEPVKTGSASAYYKIVNSILYNYDGLLQNITYGVSLIVIGTLLILIFFSANFDFKKEFVFRAVLIVVLLSAATLLNKDFIVAVIPHQIII